jgi:hypothetical protein
MKAKDDQMRLDEKLDAIANGKEVQLTKKEAESMGAFEETALSEKDAQEARYTPNIIEPTEILKIPGFVTMPTE